MLRVLKKGWPLLLVACFGGALYVCSYLYLNAHEALASGIAVNLISIPIIFMLYEYWQAFNHRKLNKSVFEYASNEMTLVMADIKQQLEPLMHGIGHYCEDLPLVIDDTDTRCIKIDLFNSSIEQIKSYFEGGYLDRGDDERFTEDLYSLDESTIASMLSGQLFIGFQIHAFDLTEQVRQLEKLIANSFIMERMTDEQSGVIVDLHLSLKTLNGFILNVDGLFIKLVSQIIGLSVSVDKDAMSSGFVGSLALELHQDGEDFAHVIDKNIFSHESLQDLNSLYLISPERCFVYGDLLVAVINNLNAWRKQHSVYIDHTDGRIGVI